MNRRKSSIIALVLLALVLPQMACGGKSIHQYTADAADATKAFLDGAKVLFDAKLISKDTYLSMLSVAETANRDTDAFKEAAVKLGTITGDNKQPLMDKISDAITIFRPVALTVISDPAQQAKFNSIVGAVQIAYTGILAALAAIKKPTPVTPKIVAGIDRYEHDIAMRIGEEMDRVDPVYIDGDRLPSCKAFGRIYHMGGQAYLCAPNNGDVYAY